MNSFKRSRLEELKIRASLLLKNLNSDDAEKATAAAKRFLQLPFLHNKKHDDILHDLSFFRLKHALAVVALENGCSNWNQLRNKVIEEDCLFHNSTSAFLNTWFNNYADAKEYQKNNGGYLLAYRKDFIVCEEGYIASIGLGSIEQEWKAIDYDWVQPRDKEARKRIFGIAKERYLKVAVSYQKPDKARRPEWLNR